MPAEFLQRVSESLPSLQAKAVGGVVRVTVFVVVAFLLACILGASVIFLPYFVVNPEKVHTITDWMDDAETSDEVTVRYRRYCAGITFGQRMLRMFTRPSSFWKSRVRRRREALTPSGPSPPDPSHR